MKKRCVSSEKTCQKVSDFSFQKVLDFTFQKVSDHRSDPTLFGPKKRRILHFRNVSHATSDRTLDIFLGPEVEEVSDFAFKRVSDLRSNRTRFGLATAVIYVGFWGPTFLKIKPDTF